MCVQFFNGRPKLARKFPLWVSIRGENEDDSKSTGPEAVFGRFGSLGFTATSCAFSRLVSGPFLFLLLSLFAARAETGVASWYGAECHGKLMANGKPFDKNALTAASWNYPLGTKVRVTYGSRSVVVTITDRGPAKRLNRVIDLSEAAFNSLVETRRGLINVSVDACSK
jgi:hypothetical protein